MLKNYLLTAWRNFWRRKVISFINLTGLILGFAFSLMILLWVEDERSIDGFHKNSSRIFNIYEREYADGKVELDYSTPGLLAEEMKKQFPEVAHASVYARNNDKTFQAGDKIIKYNGQYANEDFLKVFNYKLLAGNAKDALSLPVNIAISEKMAVDLFGSVKEAIGKTIRCENRDDFSITAVFENVPANSSITFNYLINWHIFLTQNPWAKDFSNTAPFTTVMLKENADPEQFRAKIKKFLSQYNVDEGPGYSLELDMQRYDEMYLHSNLKGGHISGGRIEYVQLFSIVSIFILLIACINFMNLTTARSLKRAKEIGVRKVAGAVRGSLIVQFIGEAILMSFLAIAIALLVVYLLLPVFNSITGKHIDLPTGDLLFWMKLTAIAMVTGLIAGIYPAFYISSFNPIKALKGNMKHGSEAKLFRKGLVVFQFTLSILLIVGTIVVSRQVDFIQTKNLGYDRENLIYIPLEGDLGSKYSLFKEEAVKLPGIKNITRISSTPTDIDIYTTSVSWNGKDPTAKPSFAHISVGYDFIKSMNAKMLLGRDFSKEFVGDSVRFILNESALKKIGYEQPLNSPLSFWDMKGSIIGVVKDFHMRSLHEPIKPLIIRLGEKETWGSILVRTEAGKVKAALGSLDKLCRQLNPKFPFTYQFADEEYQKLYTGELMIGTLSKCFAALAIFISCLGLLGLVIFTAEQRTKEIGIRKVLGASVGSVFSLLSKEFVKLVLIAIVIATPIAWWAINNWLQSFEYKVDISWWMFAIAGMAALLIALVTVSFQAIKAALANPVKSLRAE